MPGRHAAAGPSIRGALGPQAKALGEPAAALLYMIVVTIPLLLVAFAGRLSS